MLAKPLTLLCVFILAIVNFLVLLLLFSILFFPVFVFFRDIFLEFGPGLFFYLVSKISAGIIAYICLDTVCGFTLRSLRKGCVPFAQSGAVAGQKEILESFERLQKKFKMKHVNLYLNPDFNHVNAYAIGSFSGNDVTITMGLINQIHNQSKTHKEYLDSVNGILGHEMSHLANKDFIPGLLTMASENVTQEISKFIRLVFVVIAQILRIIPFIGWLAGRLLLMFYGIINLLITGFFKFTFLPIYNFLQKAFSRSTEYRCDRESAYVYGGRIMEKSLSALGKSGYFTVFSTHPSTKSRMNAVKGVLPKGGFIRPGIINTCSNMLCLLIIVLVYSTSTKLANVPDMEERYMTQIYNPVINKINNFDRQFEKLKSNFK